MNTQHASVLQVCMQLPFSNTIESCYFRSTEAVHIERGHPVILIIVIGHAPSDACTENIFRSRNCQRDISSRHRVSAVTSQLEAGEPACSGVIPADSPVSYGPIITVILLNHGPDYIIKYCCGVIRIGTMHRHTLPVVYIYTIPCTYPKHTIPVMHHMIHTAVGQTAFRSNEIVPVKRISRRCAHTAAQGKQHYM